jgi:hypothetical protein
MRRQRSTLESFDSIANNRKQASCQCQEESANSRADPKLWFRLMIDANVNEPWWLLQLSADDTRCCAQLDIQWGKLTYAH